MTDSSIADQRPVFDQLESRIVLSAGFAASALFVSLDTTAAAPPACTVNVDAPSPDLLPPAAPRTGAGNTTTRTATSTTTTSPQVSTALVSGRVSGYLHTGPYGWTYGFDLTETTTQVTLQLDIQLAGANPGTALRSTWETGIESLWSRRYDIVDGTRRLPIVLDCRFVTTGADDIVYVHTGTGRDDSANWYTSNPGGWPNSYQGLAAAHEVGHMLGLYDEYSGGATNPTTGLVDSSAIMGNLVNTVRERYYQGILTWMEQQSGRDMSLVVDTGPVTTTTTTTTTTTQTTGTTTQTNTGTTQTTTTTTQRNTTNSASRTTTNNSKKKGLVGHMPTPDCVDALAQASTNRRARTIASDLPIASGAARLQPVLAKVLK